MTERWSPLLDDLPELAGPLLSAVRSALPAVFELALQAPERTTKPVSVGIGIEADAAARLTIVGHGITRDYHGPRDALFITFDGEARIHDRRLTVLGNAVLDLATNALLQLRLTEPVAV